MGFKCVVCGIKRIQPNTLSFHSFPKDAERKKLWMDACHIRLCLPSYRVCSNHFHADQFELNGYLKKDAIPILCSSKLSSKRLNDSMPTLSESINPSKSCDSQSPNPNDETNNLTVLNQLSTPLTKKRRLFNSDTIGGLDTCHFSTPKKAKRHLDMVKNKYKQKQIQNHNLKKQIKRLQKKLASYEDLVKTLKSKNLVSENATHHLQLSGSEALRDIVNRKICGQKVHFSEESRKFSITPTKLSIVNIGPDSIIHHFSEEEKDNDNIMSVEHDHNYLETVYRLTPYVKNIRT